MRGFGSLKCSYAIASKNLDRARRIVAGGGRGVAV
jgi:hypothetical protein